MSGTPPTRHEPQLIMRLDDLSSLPPVRLPEGYSIRHYEPGDGAVWNGIVYESFGVPEEQRDGWFEKRMAPMEAFRPDRVLFVVRDGRAVGTASAWQVPNCPPEVGYLHYVAVLPSEAGRGLGLQVSLACLHKMVEEGRTAAILQTDDFRFPAIRTYLKLGFRPVLVHENQRARWRRVFQQMDQPEFIEQFRHILDGPITDRYQG